MKLQSLSIIFIIIILPISLILSSYTKSRIDTINYQSQYDSKLNDATYDALKAYQINSFSSDASDLTNVKMRDIKASVNTFFNSMASNFSSLGLTKNTMQNYVPALVYTMYDGYYIYSPYKNVWDINPDLPNMGQIHDSIKKEITDQIVPSEQETFSENENLYGLKPYVYYSCRYKVNEDNDVVITYSLDNYIQVQGKVGGKTISKYGYILNIANDKNAMGVYCYDNPTTNEKEVYYNGSKIDIEQEDTLKEMVLIEGKLEGPYQYVKKKGVKYYKNSVGEIFYVLNGKKINQAGVDFTNNNAKEYYINAYEMTNYVKDKLGWISTDKIDSIDGDNYYPINGAIFSGDVETEESNFNTHRIDVIKNAIERNLSIAISNFNNYSNVTTDFRMPKLKDTDWDKIMSNISIISFFQGANIGGKIYNGYSIITNTKNQDVVMEDSIYIKTKNDNIIRSVIENDLNNKVNSINEAVAIFNMDTEIRTDTLVDSSMYYLPVNGILSYDSIVTKSNISDRYDGNLKEYVKNNLNYNLRTIYYTALGRERNSLYRQQLEIE